MDKLRTNGCVRYKGRVSIDKDLYGWYESCLQCGYTRDLPDMVLDRAETRQKESDRRCGPALSSDEEEQPGRSAVVW